MENFNIDNFNLPMPVSEKELNEFETFVDEFSRRMDTILRGNLEDPDLGQELTVPSLLLKDTSRLATPSPAPNDHVNTAAATVRGLIDSARLEAIVSDNNADRLANDTTAQPQSPSVTAASQPCIRAEQASSARTAPSVRQSASQLMDLAKIAVREGNWDKARDLYGHVTDLSPVHSEDDYIRLRAHANLTLVYLKLKQHDLVLTHADIVLSKTPKHVKVLWRKCAALLELQHGQAWVRAQAALRRAVIDQPGELDLVRVIKDEAQGWQQLGLVASLACGSEDPGHDAESTARILFELGKDATVPILMWLVDHGLTQAVGADRAKKHFALHCAIMDLMRLVVDDPATRPVLSKLAPAAVADWLQLLWSGYGSDPTVAKFMHSHLFPSLNFVLPQIDSLAWYTAAAVHVRRAPAHTIPTLIQTLHTSSLHIQPADHTPWALLDALIASSAVDRDHIVAIAVNMLTQRPSADPPTSGHNAIHLPRLVDFLKHHGSLRLWSRLSRVPSLATVVAQMIAEASVEQVLQSTDSLRAWTVAALDAETVNPTRMLAAMLKCDKVDTKDNVIVGNTALLIARAVQRGQWREQDMEAAACVLLPILQQRMAAQGSSRQAKQDTKVNENLAIALARLSSASPKAREWMRQKRGMDLLASVTASVQ